MGLTGFWKETYRSLLSWVGVARSGAISEEHWGPSYRVHASALHGNDHYQPVEVEYYLEAGFDRLQCLRHELITIDRQPLPSTSGTYLMLPMSRSLWVDREATIATHP